jgi:hypothetical protein
MHGIANADVFVLIAVAEELLLEELKKFKKEVKMKGLGVKFSKTKIMRCRVNRVQSVDSEEHPCGVCRKGVDRNSDMCSVVG